MFNIGDKVVVVFEDEPLPKLFHGLTGTVVRLSEVYNKTLIYGVNIDNPSPKLVHNYLHTLGGYLEDRTGFWFRENRLRLFTEKELKTIDLKEFEDLYV